MGVVIATNTTRRVVKLVKGSGEIWWMYGCTQGVMDGVVVAAAAKKYTWGFEVTSIFNFAAASSTKSMAAIGYQYSVYNTSVKIMLYN